MKTMSSIRAVCLDVGWTLAYPRASMWQIFADLCSGAGVPTSAVACEQLIRGLWTVGQTHAEQQFRGGAQYSDSDADFAAQFGQLGHLIFTQMGVSGDYHQLMQRFLSAFWNQDNWVAFPEVLEVLAVLRARGVRLGVLSNAPSDLPQFLDRLGIAPYLDFCVVSASAGVKKPDRRVFDLAVTRAGVAPHELLHVGDMYVEDVLGGRAAGLSILLIERGPRAIFPSFRESEGREIHADAIVTDLTQVMERL